MTTANDLFFFYVCCPLCRFFTRAFLLNVNHYLVCVFDWSYVGNYWCSILDILFAAMNLICKKMQMSKLIRHPQQPPSEPPSWVTASSAVWRNSQRSKNRRSPTKLNITPSLISGRRRGSRTRRKCLQELYKVSSLIKRCSEDAYESNTSRNDHSESRNSLNRGSFGDIGDGAARWGWCSVDTSRCHCGSSKPRGDGGGRASVDSDDPIVLSVCWSHPEFGSVAYFSAEATEAKAARARARPLNCILTIGFRSEVLSNKVGGVGKSGRVEIERLKILYLVKRV